jgi:hypothetical protein
LISIDGGDDGVKDENDENDEKQAANTNTCESISNWITTNCQFVKGFWLGFIIQTVSLGSTAYIAIHWGGIQTR